MTSCLWESLEQNNISNSIVQHDVTSSPSRHIDTLVFIDTWHVYGQLKRELAKYAPLTKKYILMHDTTVDEWVGESVREHLFSLSCSPFLSYILTLLLSSPSVLGSLLGSVEAVFDLTFNVVIQAHLIGQVFRFAISKSFVW